MAPASKGSLLNSIIIMIMYIYFQHLPAEYIRRVDTDGGLFDWFKTIYLYLFIQYDIDLLDNTKTS